MAELPIACTLTPEALRTRREGLLVDLVRRAERREDLSDGLRFEFAPSGETIALTRVDSAFAGRAYAAYGGIYIVASLVWPWLIEGQAPTRTDLVGAALAISGALIIIGFAVRVR